MNLNEGVLDDIVDMPMMGDTVVPPGTTDTSNAAPVVLEVNKDKPSTEPTVIPEEELQKLPGMEVAFKLVENGQQKVISLKDVESEILAQESISQAGAQYVSTAFESLLSGAVKLNEFTKSPSKTNLEYTKKHMKLSIAKEEHSVVSNFQLLIDQPLNDAKEAYSKLLLSYLPAIGGQVFNLKTVCVDIEEKLQNNKNTVFANKDNSFVNLKTVDLCTVGLDGISNSALVGNIKGLQAILKHPSTNAFVHSVIDGKGFPESFDKSCIGAYMGAPLCSSDLIKFYKSDINSQIDDLTKLVQCQFECLNNVHAECLTKMVTPEMSNEFISTQMPCIEEAFSVLTRAMLLIKDLSSLNFNSKCFLDTLSKL